MKKYTEKSTQGNKIRFHFKAAEGRKKEGKLKSADSGKFPSFEFSFFVPGRGGMAPSGSKLHAMILCVGRLSFVTEKLASSLNKKGSLLQSQTLSEARKMERQRRNVKKP